MKRAKTIWTIVAAVLVLALAACGGIYGWIQWDAHQRVKAVRAACPQAGTDAEALIFQMQSDSESLRQRNMAVWIAGRLRVKEALPVMQSYYTGAECDHDNCLCQGELEKAIQRCGGDI